MSNVALYYKIPQNCIFQQSTVLSASINNFHSLVAVAVAAAAAAVIVAE